MQLLKKDYSFEETHNALQRPQGSVVSTLPLLSSRTNKLTFGTPFDSALKGRASTLTMKSTGFFGSSEDIPSIGSRLRVSRAESRAAYGTVLHALTKEGYECDIIGIIVIRCIVQLLFNRLLCELFVSNLLHS